MITERMQELAGINLDEKLVIQRSKFTKEYTQLVYEAYNAGPVKDGALASSYSALIKSNEKLFRQMLSDIDVQFIDDYEETGYKDAKDMIKRVANTGLLVIDKSYSTGHPFLSEQENWIFRAVHDYYTHILRGRKTGTTGFDTFGEFQAYNTHAKLAPKAAIPALFSEVLCQVAYVTTTGSFPDKQKSVFMKGFDFINVGEIALTKGDTTSKYSVGTYDDNFPNKNAAEYLKKKGKAGSYEIYLEYAL